MISRWTSSSGSIRFSPTGKYVLYIDYEQEIAALKKEIKIFKEMDAEAAESNRRDKQALEQELESAQ